MAAIELFPRVAAENGDISALTNWLSRGGDPNQLDEYFGYGLLHNTFELWPHERNDHSEVARLLIAHGANVNLLGRRDAVTPLHLCAFPGEADLLLDMGADINAVDKFGCTPLFNSVMVFKRDNQKAATAFARLLLRRGADVFVKDKQGHDVESRVMTLHNELADLFAAVKAAGGWKPFIRAPRVSLVRLRLLCSRGRARPPTARRDPILARLFAAPPPASSNKRLASRQVHRPLPNEIFWLILSFWRADRDD